jgi:hypothetical protein
VCSTDAGTDGIYGTSDDTYGSSASTVTDPDGHYELALDGDACWLSIAPPVPGDFEVPTQATDDPPVPALVEAPAAVVDMGGTGDVAMPTVLIERSASGRPQPDPQSPATSQADLATLGDQVWNDLDADGRQEQNEAGVANATVTLYDLAGQVVHTMVTDADGSFLFEHLRTGWYRLGVSNVPAGLRAPHTDALESRGALVAVAAGQAVVTADIGLVSASRATVSSATATLPAPSAAQIRSRGPIEHGNGLAMIVVLAMAALLAASVLFASARPTRGLHRTLR